MKWLFAIGGILLVLGCNLDDGVSRPRSLTARAEAGLEGAPPNIIRYPTVLFAKDPVVKADRTAIQRFSSEEGASAEVEAICDIRDGTDAVCWKPDGSVNENFTRRVRRRFGNPGPGQPPAPRSRNRKTRLVIAKVAMPGWNQIQLLSVGSNRGRPNVNMEVLRPRLEGEPSLFYFGGYAQEPLSSKLTSLRFALSETLDEKPILARAPGAKVVFAGDTYTLKSVQHVPARKRSGGDIDEQWRVTLERSLTSLRDVMLLITPLDRDGHKVTLLDENGDPVSDETFAQFPRTTHRYRPAECAIVASAAKNQVTLSLSFDPVKISAFVFEGSIRKVLDLTGIPLDPGKS